jgi:hypothetical protein
MYVRNFKLELYVGHMKLKVYNLASPVYHALSECLLFRIASSILFWRVTTLPKFPHLQDILVILVGYTWPVS